MVRQWAEVEGYLAAEYGMTTKQILRETSWRRLRILVSRGFTLKGPARTAEEPEVARPTDKYAKYGGFNYDAALDKLIGRTTPDPSSVVHMSLDDFVKISR